MVPMSKCPTREELLKDVLSDASWADIASKYGYSDDRFLRKKAKEWGLPPRRKFLSPSKEELEEMIKTHTPYEIADMLGYGDGGWSRIYLLCRKYGIKFDYSKNASIRSIAFTQRQLDIMYGALLGDAAFGHRKGSATASLKFCHGEKQIDYLLWKRDEFAPFVTKKQLYTSNRVSTLGGRPCYSFGTIVHPAISEAYSLCCSTGRKRISKEWLSRLSDLSVAVWYMDDGSLNRRYHTVTLCTNAYSLDEHLLLVDFFKNKYNLDAKIESRRNGQFSIRINASQSRAFMDIVSPHIPDCMKYKTW